MAQGGQQPDGFYSRKQLGSVVQALLAYLHYDSVAGLANTSTTNLMGGADVNGIALIINDTGNLHAVVELQAGTGTAILAQSGSEFTTTAGNTTGTPINVYYDTDHFEVENQTGGAIDLEVLTVRVP